MESMLSSERLSVEWIWFMSSKKSLQKNHLTVQLSLLKLPGHKHKNYLTHNPLKTGRITKYFTFNKMLYSLDLCQGSTDRQFDDELDALIEYLVTGKPEYSSSFVGRRSFSHKNEGVSLLFWDGERRTGKRVKVSTSRLNNIRTFVFLS